jgi:hypothetical protein
MSAFVLLNQICLKFLISTQNVSLCTAKPNMPQIPNVNTKISLCTAKSNKINFLKQVKLVMLFYFIVAPCIFLRLFLLFQLMHYFTHFKNHQFTSILKTLKQ